MLKRAKLVSSFILAMMLTLVVAANCFAASISIGSFSLWQSGSTKAYTVGTNGITVPEGGTEVNPNYVAAQQKSSQVAHGLQFYGAFKGPSKGSDGAQEMAVFIADDVSSWTGHEMGFLKTLNDGATKAYLQGPGGLYKWAVVATNDNGYHTFKAVVRDSSHVDTVDYYVDGVYKCTLTNSGVNYWNLNYYFVGTTHRTTTGWSSSGDQIEMYDMQTF